MTGWIMWLQILKKTVIWRATVDIQKKLTLIAALNHILRILSRNHLHLRLSQREKSPKKSSSVKKEGKPRVEIEYEVETVTRPQSLELLKINCYMYITVVTLSN